MPLETPHAPERDAELVAPSPPAGPSDAVTVAEGSPMQGRAICVTVPHEGKPCKAFGNVPADFLPALKDAEFAWLDFTVDDIERESESISSALGFSTSLAPSLVGGYYSAFEDRETELGMMLPAVTVEGLEVKIHPLLVLVRKDLILTLHPRAVLRLQRFYRYADSFIRKIPPATRPIDRLTMVLVRILDENNIRNFEHLREIEEQADAMSEGLLDPETSRSVLGRQIYEMKHALITYLNMLWRTLDVIHSLAYGDAELVSDSGKLLAQIGMLAEDVRRQIALSEHMSEVLASGLEVLQSIYNNQLQILNNRMAMVITWLTVLGTAVLVPNTIATIWGGLRWRELVEPSIDWFFIGILVISTLASTYLAYWWVNKWVKLPRAPLA